jgi:ParB-like chromosome segregation protein Spo0J
MNIENTLITDLIPYANNAREHSDDQILQIASSIKEFGFNNPILIDKDNGIIAGHGRLAAAKMLGMTEVPTIKLEHLTDAQRKAFILADNRIAINSTWNTDLLALELEDLQNDFDLKLLGFNEDEVNALIDPEFLPASEDEQGKLDELDPKWIDCPHCGKEFDARKA